MAGKWLKRSLVAATVGLSAFAVKLGKDALQAAGETEKQLNRLNRLLLTTGGASEAQIKSLNAQAKALQQLGVVSANNVTIVQSQLATFDLAGSSIAKLTPAILDYVTAERGATASTDEFKSMTNGLAQALQGNFASLSRVGFVLDENTKKMIKSGTESERAQALVDVLNSTYKDFNKSLRDTPEGQTQVLKNELSDLSEELGKSLLPLYQQTVGVINSKVVPAFRSFLEVLKGGGLQTLLNGLKFLRDNLTSIASAIFNTLQPALTGFLLPTFMLLVGAIAGLIRGLGLLGNYINNNIERFQNLAFVVGAGVVALGAYKAAIFLVAKATATWNLVQAALNKTLVMNPIGAIVAGVVLLIAAFIKAWNTSDGFRNAMVTLAQVGTRAMASLIRAIAPVAETILQLVTGPIRSLLRGLSFLGIKSAGRALDVVNKGLDNVAEFGSTAADKLDKLANAMDNVRNKKISLPKLFEMPRGGATDMTATTDWEKFLEGLDFGDPSDFTFDAKETGKKVVKNLQDVVESFNDYIEGDFAQGFTRGATSARDTVLSAISQVRRVFEEQGKNLEGKELENFMKGFDKLNQRLRAYIPQAEQVAGELESVEDQLQEATRRLEKSQDARIAGAKKLNDLLRKPFGEPSALMGALDGATATVDSIIATYDSLIEAIEDRFAGFEGPAKDRLVEFLTKQTTALVALARRRVSAIEALNQAEDDLKEVVRKQEEFADNVKKSLSTFATALANLADGDSKAVIQVIKTASGLVITQMKTGLSDIEKITKQMRERLVAIQTFATNIRTLLSRGVSKAYVESLLKAGPDAAGETAQALATASDSQLRELNSMYSQITNLSESFGNELSQTFYGNAVSMAQAFVSGAKAEVDSIDSQMKTIRESVETEINKLGAVGYNAGNDLAQQMVDSLKARQTELIGLANSIAQSIADAMKTALKGIDVTGISTAIRPTPTVTTTTPTGRAVTTEQVDNSTKVDTINLTVNTTEPVDAEYVTFLLGRALGDATVMRAR